MSEESNEIMNNYGIKYSGAEILAYAREGKIEPEKPINMLQYQSLYLQDPKSPDYVEPVSYDALLDFYSPETSPGRLHSILREEKIDENFSTLHTELLNSFSKKKQQSYYQSIVTETKELNSSYEEVSNDLLNYANSRILPDIYLSGNITPKFLIEKYEKRRITDFKSYFNLQY